MIASIIIIFIYMALVGKSRIELEVIHRLGYGIEPSFMDIFLIEPMYTVKGILVEGYHYCLVCISNKHLEDIVGLSVEDMKKGKNL